MRGIEPLALAWKAKVLPLYDIRAYRFAHRPSHVNEISYLGQAFLEKSLGISIISEANKELTEVKLVSPNAFWKQRKNLCGQNYGH